MHILDEVQDIHINAREPFHHVIIACHDFVVIQIFGSNRAVTWTHLIVRFFVNAAVNRVKQALSQVRAGAEELHFFAGFSCRDAAANRIVVSPNWAHHIIVFILDGAGFHRNIRRIGLKSCRKALRIQNREVGFGSRAHVL